MTVSDPNQVAKSADPAKNMGNFRPAKAKSAVFFTRRAAQKPIAMVANKYMAMNKNSIDDLFAVSKNTNWTFLKGKYSRRVKNPYV